MGRNIFSNVFVKPNEQSQACLNFAVARKRLNLFEHFGVARRAVSVSHIPGKGECCDGADGVAVIAVVVVRVVVAAVEVEVVRVVGVGRVARTRPVVAVRAVVVERLPIAVTRGRER